MSLLFDWREAIITSLGLTAPEKLVALALSCRMNQDGGSCFPSMKTLAVYTSMSADGVSRIIARLEGAGWLAVERTTGKRNQYVATLPTGAIQDRGRSRIGAIQDRDTPDQGSEGGDPGSGDPRSSARTNTSLPRQRNTSGTAEASAYLRAKELVTGPVSTEGMSRETINALMKLKSGARLTNDDYVLVREWVMERDGKALAAQQEDR